MWLLLECELCKLFFAWERKIILLCNSWISSWIFRLFYRHFEDSFVFFLFKWRSIKKATFQLEKHENFPEQEKKQENFNFNYFVGWFEGNSKSLIFVNVDYGGFNCYGKSKLEQLWINLILLFVCMALSFY